MEGERGRHCVKTDRVRHCLCFCVTQHKLLCLSDYLLRPTVNGIAHLPCIYGIAFISLEVIVRNRVIQKCVTYIDDQQLLALLLPRSVGVEIG